MTYFDTSLEAEPVTEQQSTPALPEERHVFELVGFERSQPDEYRKDGGIKWTWRVFQEDGRTPFVFNDEQYLFFRTTNHDKKTRKPLFTIGSDANDWASALLGRSLGIDAHVAIPDLYGKRMSAMVVWERQKKDKSKWTVKLASLRHVPVAQPVAAQTAPSGGVAVMERPSVAANAADSEIDRAALVVSVQKKIRQAEILQTAKHLDWIAIDLNQMDADELQDIMAAVQQDIDA